MFTLIRLEKDRESNFMFKSIDKVSNRNNRDYRRDCVQIARYIDYKLARMCLQAIR